MIAAAAKQSGKWKVSSSIFTLLLMCTFSLQGQIGGKHIYSFLNLSSTSRTTALGGSQIVVIDQDAGLALNNPALLNSEMDKAISFQHNFHLAGISNGFASVARHFDKLNTTFHGGIQYINYGEFIEADVFGNQTGTFKGNELAIVIGAGRALNERMRVGTNLKLINSRLADYSSFGLAFDAGFTYSSEDGSTVYGIVFKNIGGQLSKYYEDAERETIPFDLQFGISKRLTHLPFRFTVIAHDMHQWNLLYDDPNAENGSIVLGEESSEPDQFGMQVDNLFRHLIFSGEFLLGKKENFNLRFAYNHQLKKELSVSGARSLTGFSLGFGLRISKFTLDYGMGIQHLAGSVKHIGISTNLNRFTRSKGIEDL